MAKRAYIIPRRNDLNGLNIHVDDLFPNTSQHNGVYDGEGQTGYLKWSIDQPGVTNLVNGVYSSGSLTTSTASAMSADIDTNGAGGVDSRVSSTTDYGLVAYLRERVNADHGGNNTILTSNQAAALAAAIVLHVDVAGNCDAAYLNAATAVVLAGTDFDGTVVNGSLSFGVVEDVLRILQGETYVVPANTILTANGNGQVFKSDAQRIVLRAAAVAAYKVVGHFVASTEPGYRPIKAIVMSGHVKGSAGGGVLAGLKKAMTLKNSAFDYSGTTALPVAKKLGGGAIPATGLWPAVLVYDATGTLI